MPYTINQLRAIHRAVGSYIEQRPQSPAAGVHHEAALVKAIKACPDLMLHFGATKEESKADFQDGYEKGCADMVANWTEIKEACGDDTLDDYNQLATSIRGAIEAAEQRGRAQAESEAEEFEIGDNAVKAAVREHFDELSKLLGKRVKLMDLTRLVSESIEAARSPYPKSHGTHIIQFHDQTFVWYDEALMQGGCTYSLKQAELELAQYAKRMNEEPSARFYGLPGYERLAAVLQMAHDQAAGGKGKERHANDKPFHEQRMLSISHELGSPYGMAYQACKKISEGLQLGDFERTVAELLGAINYTAGIVVYLQDKQPTFMTFKPSTAENWGQGSCASGQMNADGDVESEPEQHHPV